MRGPRISLPVAVAAGVFVLLLAFGLFVLGPGGNAAADAGGMEAMSLDMDVAGNTATSLGPWDGCVEARPGDLLTLDVTALNIPASAPMIGFTFVVGYQEAVVRVESQDARFLLAANAGSALLNLSEATPDQDFNDSWEANALDISGTPAESGSGILSRLGVTVGRDAPNGQYVLMLMSGYYLDDLNEYGFPKTLNAATIAVGVPCPPVGATQTPA
ncbi:MAG TPA: hypothetical protein VFO59_09755, partial [Dehalococcoidia bacterium]|nr:hypothetical protein [Dehalococcoidia bacterium]